tara:strand:+ start:5781 stop:6506 length:726 start_codon:yes stop_codon:yes gene_type:complete
MINTIKTYFSDTKTLLYSFLLSLPVFLAYEVLILISQPDASHVVRISVDVWFKYIFTSLGVNAVSISLLLVALFGLFILYKERERLKTLRFKFFPIMIGEAMIYAVVVAFITQTLVSLIFNISATDPITQLTGLQKFALSLGAGLYEELFFRVILVSVFLLIFNKVFNNVKWASITASVVLSALLFSAVHYIGDMGDPFTFSSFMFRFIFGLILNGIYVARGFGVAVWTHALYDVMVLLVF